MGKILTEISEGELLDKISILEIKLKEIENEMALAEVKKEYDILINLCDSSCIPIKYLVASSVARFKIGQHEDGYEIYDLMISLNEDKSLEKLMSQIRHYLQLINK